MIPLLLSIALQEPKTPQIPFELEKDRIPSIKTGGDCLIQNATIYTVTKGVIQNGSILVRGGKIAAVGTNVTAPAGITIIDAKGKIVTPGLVDAHTHLASDATNEGSDAITPEARIPDVLNPNSPSIYQKLACGNTTSLVLHGSANPIGGESQIIKHKYMVPTEELPFPGAPRVVKFALGENVKRSNSATSTRFPGTRMGVEAVYRRAFTEAKNYMAAWDRWNKDRKGPQPRKDVRLEALSDMIRGKIIIHCHAYRQDEMLMLTKVAKEFGLKLVAFQHALEAYKIAPELKAAGVGASVFTDHWNFKIEASDAIPYSMAILLKKGIVTSVHTDSGGAITPFNLEAAKAMRYGGASAEDALKMVTIFPAMQLGIDKKVGSIEIGKDADLALWDGHPLSVYSRCAMTLVDGQVGFVRRDAFGLDSVSVLKTTLDAKPNLGPMKPVPQNARVYAIVGGTIHPMSGGTIQNGTIVVRDGKIEAIGKVSVPKDAVIVDAKGAHVYPGMIDAGSDMGLVEFSSTRATNDATEFGSFQPDLLAIAAVNPESEKIPVARLGGITAALATPLGNGLNGQSALIHMGGFTNDQIALAPKAAMHLRFPESSFGAGAEDGAGPVEILEEQLARSKRYAIARQEEPSTPVDPRMEALVPYAKGERPMAITANTQRGIRDAVAFAKRNGLKMILEGGKEAWKVADLLAKENIPVLIPLPTWASPSAGSQARALLDYDPVDAMQAMPAVLHRAGVKFAFQSGNSEETSNLPLRAGYACAYGLPREAALRALTVGAAEILGVSDQIGTLAPGKLASLVITDGDPMEIQTQIRQVFVNGQPVAMESKWTRLYDKYKSR